MTDPIPVPRQASGYAWYALSILFVVYLLNFVDRQIVAILADDIKKDLGLKDQDIGFLFGTAFAVFYALFGIPLGRLADRWHRVRLMTMGLTLWSAMTALSGFAQSGLTLSLARVGVGIGEASASPAAYSIISDYFPSRLRGTALAIYSSGIYVGGGCSLFIGGLIVDQWNHAFPGGGPLGLVGWQAAFLAVGLPGLLLAIIVATLREPVRGAMDGLPPPPPRNPWPRFLDDLITIIPPFTLIGAARRGGRALAINLLVAALVAGVVALLVRAGEPVAQWAAVGLGAYAIYSWASALRQSDPPSFALIVANRAFLAVVIGYGLNAFVAYAVAVWATPYAMRVFAETHASAGLWIGGPAALAGFLGITIGGRVADLLHERTPSGRVLVILAGAILPIIPLILAFTATDKVTFYAMVPLFSLLATGALGAAAATSQELVLPRMRGTATAAYFIGTTMIGLALGPYLAGRISTLTGSLGAGVLSLLAVTPVAIIAGVLALRWLPGALASREARARAAGEPI